MNTNYLFEKRKLFTALALLAISLPGRAQTFRGAITPSDVFPLPTRNLPATPVRPTTTIYEGRDGGSCYNQTFDFDGDGDLDEVYVWAICNRSVEAYNSAVAYKVTDKTSGALLYRGTHLVDTNITELNVGMYKVNGAYYLAAAYWKSGLQQIRLNTYAMSTTGLTLSSNTMVAPHSAPDGKAQHLSMDSHDLKYFTIGWEDRGPWQGIFLKAYKATATGLVSSPNVLVATNSIPPALPDIAMTHHAFDSTDTTGLEVHFAFVDPMGTIFKWAADFNDLFSGIGTIISFDDFITLGGPIGSRFDQFQLKLDVPDHYSTPLALPNWSYVYYNGANKINLRLCNRALSTPINSYVVNDGSLSGSSGDITTAGNAFPSVTYHPHGDKVYVAWFTTYDSTKLPALDIYTYQNFSQRYVSVVVDDNGNQLSPAYQRVDMNYRLNSIYNYPKICLSKHNESAKLFTIFACHGPVNIWPYAMGLPFLGKYSEYAGAPTGIPTPATPLTARLNYGGVVDTVRPGLSMYIANKATNWYSGAPYYKKAAAETADNISAYPNPFNQQQVFRLAGGNPGEEYSACLVSVDGRIITTQKGSLEVLNDHFRSVVVPQLMPGVYLLRLVNEKSNYSQQIRLIRQ